MPINDYARRTATSYFGQSRRGVGKIARAIPAAQMPLQDPAGMHPFRHVEESRGSIPRKMMISLAIAVDGEELAKGVEIKVVDVAETMGDDFGVFSVRGEPQNRSRFGLLNWGSWERCMSGGDAGIITAGDINPAI